MSTGTSQGETVLFQDGSIVTITTSRAVIMGTTYAMANITSVRQHEEAANIGCLAGIAIFGVIIGLLMVIGGNNGIGWLLLLGGIGAAVAAYVNRRSKHWVRIGTAGAETNAVCSYDKAWTARVVTALNDAIIARG